MGRLLRSYVLIIGLALAATFLIRLYLIEAYRVPSEVMSPALLPGETIFVTKWWGGRVPRRGQVVVFNNPLEGGADFVRRVVGMPGDRIELKKGQILLNGKPTAEAAALPHCVTEVLEERRVRACWDQDQPANLKEVQVPEGSVFVLADHRSPIPLDSRKPVGELVSVKNIRGRVWLIWLSVESKSERSWISRIRFDRMFRSV